MEAIIKEFFNQRREEIIAWEIVTEVGVSRKHVKQCWIVLARPLANVAIVSDLYHNDASNLNNNNNNKNMNEFKMLKSINRFDHMGKQPTVNLVRIDKQKCKVKLLKNFNLLHLTEVTHEGSFDASFNFTVSGIINVSFQSFVQREMFIVAVEQERNLEIEGEYSSELSWMSKMKRPKNSNKSFIHGILTDTVDKETESAAASRIRQLRLQKRRVYTKQQERNVLRAISSIGLDDTNEINNMFLQNQKIGELVELDKLINSESTWEGIQRDVQKLVTEVEDVERRVENYSQHLIGKKDVIREIEHSNNNLQNRRENLEKLESVICNLQSQLNLDPSLTSVIYELNSAEDDKLTSFFSDNDKAVKLSSAIGQMEIVIHNTELEYEYPISAVEERKTYFKELRSIIAHKTHKYLLQLIDSYECLFLSERERFSREGYIVWKSHAELHDKLITLSKIIKAMLEIEPENYVAILRKYRVTSQRIYALEIHRFFKSLRRELEKISIWHEPFLLGSKNSRSTTYWNIFDTLNSQNNGCQTTQYTEQIINNSFTSNTCTSSSRNGSEFVSEEQNTPHYQSIKEISPMPTSSVRRSLWHAVSVPENDNAERSNTYRTESSANKKEESKSSFDCSNTFSKGANECIRTCVRVELPSSSSPQSVNFHCNVDTLTTLNIPKASVSFAGSLQSLSPSNVFGGDKKISLHSGRNADGYLHPDLAVAMMLKAVLTVIEQEESVLLHAFGLSESAYYQETMTDTNNVEKCGEVSVTPVECVNNQQMSEKNCNIFPSTDTDGKCNHCDSVIDEHTWNENELKDNALMIESLLEIFGGDKPTTALIKQVQGCVVSGEKEEHFNLHLPQREHERYDINRCDTNFTPSNNSLDKPCNGSYSFSTANSDLLYQENMEGVIKEEFCFLVREAVEWTSFVVEKCDRMFTIPIMCMLKSCKTNKSWKCAQSPFCQILIRELESIVAQGIMRFVAEQTASITHCRNKYLIKPTALLHCFSNLPSFFLLQEEIFASFHPTVRDYSTYDSISNSFLKQVFTALEVITEGKENIAGEREEGLHLKEIMQKRFSETFSLSNSQKNVFKEGVIQQYRHHAFFCAVYYLFPPTTHTSSILQEYFTLSHERRRRSQEIYLTRILFLHHFPRFGPFVLAAEDLSSVYSSENLRHHKSLSVENVSNVTAHLGEELRNGIKSSSTKMKKHLLHHVHPGSKQETFHSTLLQRT